MQDEGGAKAGQNAGFRFMLKYFGIKKAFRYYIKQIDSMLPCVWFSNRSQKTSKCGKNISDTLGYASCATYLFLPHFDVICDLLLNRRTATWNLFVNQISKQDNVYDPPCLRPSPHVSGYFRKQRFFLRLHLPSTRIRIFSKPEIFSPLTPPVHTYPDIFENRDFFSVCSSRQHVNGVFAHKYGGFWKRYPDCKFLKTDIYRIYVDDRKRRFSNTRMTSKLGSSRFTRPQLT